MSFDMLFNHSLCLEKNKKIGHKDFNQVVHF